MDLNNIRECATYYVPSQLETDVRDGDFNQYFIGTDGVYEVSHMEADDPIIPDAIYADIAVIGDDSNYLGHVYTDLDMETIDNVQEFAFNMGVPYEEIDPGFNAEGEYVNDVSYGELAEYEAALPGKITEYAQKQGIAVLPLYQAENDHLSTEPENHNYHLAGFISTKIDPDVSPTLVFNELRDQVEVLNNVMSGDIYKVSQLDPSTGSTISETPLFGSDPDDNGLTEIVDTDNFVGESSRYDSIKANHNFEKMVENEWNRVNGYGSYQLEAKYDARNSFYGKAKVEMEDHNKTLYSYGQAVVTVDPEFHVATRHIDDMSPTTLRHVKEFLKQEIGPMSYDELPGKTDKAKIASLPKEDRTKSLEQAKDRHNADVKDRETAKTRSNDIDK